MVGDKANLPFPLADFVSYQHPAKPVCEKLIYCLDSDTVKHLSVGSVNLLLRFSACTLLEFAKSVIRLRKSDCQKKVCSGRKMKIAFPSMVRAAWMASLKIKQPRKGSAKRKKICFGTTPHTWYVPLLRNIDRDVVDYNCSDIWPHSIAALLLNHGKYWPESHERLPERTHKTCSPLTTCSSGRCGLDTLCFLNFDS